MKLYELKHNNKHNTSCDVYSLTKRLYPDFQFTTSTGKAPARTKNARHVQVTSDYVTRANNERLSFWQEVKAFIDNEY